ncbi:hypothetical protein KRR26_24020 [Corallococcus sp. M34]|uniref:hypothetical protein n=1 Tax=Citreicoccus inhibens TaxID=2849499 RepID=UPI0011C36045|nr:hypothetical protein [Citreicoccus inhibens]MBU8898683.1 hypothetical protein [Citreicoccus inhibens]
MTTVLYVHGLESGPRGTKARMLEQAGFRVVSAQMPCNRSAVVRDPVVIGTVLVALGVLGVATWALGWVGALVAGAVLLGLQPFAKRWLVRRTVQRSIDVQLAMLKSYPVDVVVGSSFGGAIALELLARGAWTGRTVLLCPAQRLVAERVGHIAPALPSDVSRIVVVHGRQDETVPLAHSRALVAPRAARLIEVDDQHRLANTATPENFKQWIALTG